MPVESRTQSEDPTPFEETPALAATATAMIDAALTGTALSRDVYWAAVRKSYNAPYNDPQPKPAAPASVTIVLAETETESAPMPVAAMAPPAMEMHAG